jgi:phage terminase small subunit
MSAEVSQPRELTLKQRRLIALLVSGSSMIDAARSVGVAEKTAHAWRKQPAFLAAYQEAREQADKEVWANAMQQLKNSVPQALQVLAKHASCEDVEVTASSQLRAAVVLVEKAIELTEIEEIKARLAALEERLK